MFYRIMWRLTVLVVGLVLGAVTGEIVMHTSSRVMVGIMSGHHASFSPQPLLMPEAACTTCFGLTPNELAAPHGMKD